MEKIKKNGLTIALISLVVIFLIGLITIIWQKEFSVNKVLILVIVSVSLFVTFLLAISALSSKKNDPHALGLPTGSVRAIIAISIILLFILTSIYFFQVINADDDKVKIDLAKSILAVLGTLAVAVSSFYFSAKATQQGIDAATKAFKDSNEDSGSLEEAIIDAIAKNEKDWKKKYKIEAAKLGKKESEGNQLEIQCIVFWVKKKEIPTNESQEIPKLIKHTFKGKVYEIVTDIKEQTISDGGFSKLEKSKQYKIAENFLQNNLKSFIEKHPSINGARVGYKVTNGQSTDAIAIILQIKDKGIIKDKDVPEYIEIYPYRIPTDVEKATKTTTQSNEALFQSGISTVNNGNEFGSFGFPVLYDNELHFTSCYHVLFADELKRKKNSKINDSDHIDNSDVYSPPIKEGGNQIIGKTVCGEISNFLDIGIFEPTADFKGKIDQSKLANAYRTLKRVDENRLYVKFWGNGSKRNKEVLVKDIFSSQVIEYPGIGDVLLQGLVAIEKSSLPGDSGSALYDFADDIVGLIIGADDLYTYAISAFTIFKKTKYKLIN